MGHIFRAIRISQSKHDMALSYGYVQSVLAVVPQLLGLADNLTVVQTLIGVVLILEGTPDAKACRALMASALGLIHAMGLHRKDRDPPGMTPSEVEERRNVFWIAYWIETNISYLSRQPSIQDDDEIDVNLPAGTTTSQLQTPLGTTTRAPINILNSRIGLAIIQGQIYKRLFSVQAVRQSKAQLATSALELGALLAHWRSNVPFDFGEAVLTDLSLPLPEDFLQIVILYTVYVDCVITVDRHVSQQTPSDSTRSAFPPEAVSVMESRRAIFLLQKIPRGNYAFIWLLIGTFFEAAVALLQNVIRYPFHPLADTDISLVEPFMGLLEHLKDGSNNVGLHKMQKQCSALVQDALAATNAAREIGGHDLILEVHE